MKKPKTPNPKSKSNGEDIFTAQGAERAAKRNPLRVYVRDAVENYLSQLNGYPACSVYRMVLDEVECPLLQSAMRHSGGNQSKAAELLGINRGTLRKKLREHGLE